MAFIDLLYAGYVYSLFCSGSTHILGVRSEKVVVRGWIEAVTNAQDQRIVVRRENQLQFDALCVVG